MSTVAALAKTVVVAWTVLVSYACISVYLLTNFNPKVIEDRGIPVSPTWALNVYDFMRPVWALNWLVVPVFSALCVSLTFVWWRVSKRSRVSSAERSSTGSLS